MLRLLLLIALSAPAAGAEPVFTVQPLCETASAPSTEDAADDPAIWVHPTDPKQSLVLGTNKQGGLMVMDMQGALLQYLEGGTPNNVDLRHGFELGGEKVSLAVASDRDSNGLLAWKVNTETRQLEPVPVQGCKPAMEVYGLGLYQSASSGKLYAFITSKPGRVEQWELNGGDSVIEASLARSFVLSGQNEGCVADDQQGVVYIAEEEKALWRVAAEPDAEVAPVAVDHVQPNGRLAADVEGLALCRDSDGRTYLIASSQGDSTFCVYNGNEGNAFIAQFKIGASEGIDAVTGTDGIEALCADLGPGFEQGAFVVQDDENDTGNQNFKLVPWERIRSALNPKNKTSL